MNNIFNNKSHKISIKLTCLLLCLCLPLITINVNALSIKTLESKNSKHKIDTLEKSKKNEPTAKSLATDTYYYCGQQTHIYVKHNNKPYEDKTTEILNNGYLGKVGDDTTIKLVYSGYRYKEPSNTFKYYVHHIGETRWSGGIWADYYYAHQNGSGSTGAANKKLYIPFYDSQSYKYYCRCRVAAYSTDADHCEVMHNSEYKYIRKLDFYPNPKSVLKKNGNNVSGTNNSGNTHSSSLTKSYIAEYNTITRFERSGTKHGAFAWWAMIANSYDDLQNTNRYDEIKSAMQNGISADGGVAWPDAVNDMNQWYSADDMATSQLSAENFPTTDDHRFYISKDIKLKDITNPNSITGKYNISIDDGACSSQSFQLSLYKVQDKLTMKQSSTQGSVAKDTANITIYNGLNSNATVTTGNATATLDGDNLELVEDNFFKPSNVESIGSNKTMSKLEAKIDNKNLNTNNSLGTINNNSSHSYEISINNANAISHQKNGTLAIPVTLTAGSKATSTTIDIELDSQVPQITVSVPVSIHLYVAKDGSAHVPCDYYSLINKSLFPLTSKVSATLLECDTTGKDNGNNPFFPELQTDSDFKLWIKPNNGSKIRFRSINSGQTPTSFSNFGSIAANNGTINFKLLHEGCLPNNIDPGTYHYKIYFRFYYSADDYS